MGPNLHLHSFSPRYPVSITKTCPGWLAHWLMWHPFTTLLLLSLELPLCLTDLRCEFQALTPLCWGYVPIQSDREWIWLLLLSTILLIKLDCKMKNHITWFFSLTVIHRQCWGLNPGPRTCWVTKELHFRPTWCIFKCQEHAMNDTYCDYFWLNFNTLYIGNLKFSPHLASA